LLFRKFNDLDNFAKTGFDMRRNRISETTSLVEFDTDYSIQIDTFENTLNHLISTVFSHYLLIPILADGEIDVAMGSPLTVIMRKVKEISTQLATQLKKSLVELPNSSVSQNVLQHVLSEFS
jgi:hypothetical protein